MNGSYRDREVIVHGTVEVSVSIGALERDGDRRKKEALEKAVEGGDGEVVEVFIEGEEPA